MSETSQPIGRISGVAVAGFVASLVALIAAVSFRWWVLILVVVALILSGVGLTQTREEGRSGRGFAVAGLAIGCVVAAGMIAIVLGVLRF